MGRKKADRTRGQIISRGDKKFLLKRYVGLRNGRRQYRATTFHGTRTAAEKEMTKLLAELDGGRYVEPSKLALRDYLRRWWEGTKALKWQPRTAHDYWWMLENYVLPTLGDVRLDRLHVEDVRRLYGELSERLSPRTVQYTHNVLKQALQQAVDDRRLLENPAARVKLPKQRRTERRVLTAEELSAFLAATTGTEMHPAWVLLAYTGMRPGEAFALTWDDVDAEAGVIRVERALKRAPKGQPRTVGDPKTDGSRRAIAVPGTVFDALEAHRLTQLRHILKAGRRYARRGFVFANKRGNPLDEGNVRRRFYAALKAAGVPKVRLYDMRHSHASLCLKNGESVKVVQERLGHSTPILTLNTYAHVIPGMDKAASERFDTLLQAASGCT